jgi:hypothetical protein
MDASALPEFSDARSSPTVEHTILLPHEQPASPEWNEPAGRRGSSASVKRFENQVDVTGVPATSSFA